MIVSYNRLAIYRLRPLGHLSITLIGLEPTTSGLWIPRSNQLSYRVRLMFFLNKLFIGRITRFELVNHGITNHCLNHLAIPAVIDGTQIWTEGKKICNLSPYHLATPSNSGMVGIEPNESRSQSPLPFHLATSHIDLYQNPELNWGPLDLQSIALPTELSWLYNF